MSPYILKCINPQTALDFNSTGQPITASSHYKNTEMIM